MSNLHLNIETLIGIVDAETLYNIQYTETTSNVRNVNILCCKWANSNSSKITRSTGSTDFCYVIPYIYKLLILYMENAITQHRIVNGNMVLTITKNPNYKAKTNIAEHKYDNVDDPEHQFNVNGIRICTEPTTILNINTTGDDVTVHPDGSETHTYYIIRDGWIDTHHKFRELLEDNSRMLQLHQLQYVYNRLLWLNIIWKLPNQHITCSYARYIYNYLFGKKIYLPLTVSGIKVKTYLTFYSQLLSALYSHSTMFRVESCKSIPIY